MSARSRVMTGPTRWAARTQCRRYASSPDPRRSVEYAREQCLKTVRTFDYPSYIIHTFIPPHARDAFLALTSLNIEVSRIADSTSTPAVGALRAAFWRDTTKRAVTRGSTAPSAEPVAILLAHAAESLDALSSGRSSFSTAWLNRLITARERRLSNPPFVDLAAMESYAENTYSTLSYLILSAFPLASVTVDHVASHIGKAAGIAALLRGVPATAFPNARPMSSSTTTTTSGGGLSLGGQQRHGAVILPLDIMASCGVQEEAVLRHGPDAPGLADAVFQVATRANDHLITARTMLAQLSARTSSSSSSTSSSQSVIDHPFEHEHDPDGREYTTPLDSVDESVRRDLEDVRQAFGVLLPAVSTRLWLERLQRANFDVFSTKLRSREWRLPISAYWAFRRKKI